MTSLAPPLHTYSPNRAALLLSQPELSLSTSLPPDLNPTPGRDGSPTLRFPDGSWWKSCSVPRAASRAMLDSLTGSSPLACFLHPLHPAALAEALAILSPTQSVVALLESPEDLPLFLACDDFTSDLAAHRLFFAPTPDHLAAFLTARPGLPTPGQFIRTNVLDDSLCRSLIEACQSIFTTEHARRLALVERLSSRPTPTAKPPRHIVVSTHSRFRLWDDASSHLLPLLSSIPSLKISPWPHDDPLHSSPLALLQLAHTADALLTANFYRPSAQGILPTSLPLLTLVTSGPISPYTPHTPDRLLLTHPSFLPLARQAGWPESHLTLAYLPTPTLPPPSSPAHLAFLADTLPLPPDPTTLPSQIEDFSSHRLLWERVSSELTANPLRAGNDILAYLSAVRVSMSIPEDSFPLAFLAERLAIPLWQQSLARLLISAGLPLRLYGTGWSLATPDLTLHYHGPLTSRPALLSAAAAATVLLPPLPLPPTPPLPAPDPIHSLPRPILPLPYSPDTTAFLRLAKSLLASPPPPPTNPLPPLTPDLLFKLLQ